MPTEYLAIVALALRRQFPPPKVDPLALADEKGRVEIIRRTAHQEVIAAFEDAAKIQKQRHRLETTRWAQS